MFSDEKNRELLLKVKHGDKKAFDELVLSNMGLVKAVSRRFENRGAETRT